MPTLDVQFSQVLVDYVNDANFLYHHRVLLVSLGGSRWVCATPTLSLQPIDLSDHQVIVLRRNAAFPVARRNDSFVFDPDDVPADVLADLVARANELAGVLGAPAPAAVPITDVWRISDLTHKSFGKEVPAAVLQNDELFKSEDEVALVRIDGRWTQARRETPDTVGEDSFCRQFHSGPGRDKRVMSDTRDPDGRRFIALSAILPLLMEIVWPQWPIAGPRSVKEFLLAVRAAGQMALLDYHNEWVKSSGVAPGAAHTREHRFILEVLRLLLQYVQVDASSLAGCELLCRRLYQIELAVRKAPKNPDFAGLEFLLETAVDSSGGAVLPSIAKWLGETQHKEAFTLKQMRLWSEEKASLEKHKGKNKNNKEKEDG